MFLKFWSQSDTTHTMRWLKFNIFWGYDSELKIKHEDEDKFWINNTKSHTDLLKYKIFFW